MIEWILLITLFALLVVFWQYIKLNGVIEARAVQIFHQWRSVELREEAARLAELMHEEWRQREEARVRKEAILQSEAVIRGKVTEHLIPFFPEFDFNPKDIRFLGTPVDFIVFDGLCLGGLHEIVFVEIKTGRNPVLSQRERTVRECIRDKKVSYRIIHHRSGLSPADEI